MTASPSWLDPRRSCHTKKAYSTEKLAKTVARERGEQYGDALRVYFCEHCSQYHITKTPKRQTNDTMKG